MLCAAAAALPPAACRRSPLNPRRPFLQIRVKDGRVLVGEFACMDKQGNVILLNTYEHVTIDGRCVCCAGAFQQRALRGDALLCFAPKGCHDGGQSLRVCIAVGKQVCCLLKPSAGVPATPALPRRLYEKQMGQVLVGAAQRVSCEFEALPFEEERLRQLLASAGG